MAEFLRGRPLGRLAGGVLALGADVLASAWHVHTRLVGRRCAQTTAGAWVTRRPPPHAAA